MSFYNIKMSENRKKLQDCTEVRSLSDFVRDEQNLIEVRSLSDFATQEAKSYRNDRRFNAGGFDTLLTPFKALSHLTTVGHCPDPDFCRGDCEV